MDEDPSIFWLQETHLIHKDARRLKLQRWEEMSHDTRKQRRAGLAIPVPEQTITQRLLEETEKYRM